MAEELHVGSRDSVESYAVAIRDHFEIQFAEGVRQLEWHAHEHCEHFAAAVRARSHEELIEAELSAASRHAHDEQELASARAGEARVSRGLRLEIASLHTRAAAEQE
eukprot:7783027-Lingulodinium_polyedra.AAC.1